MNAAQGKAQPRPVGQRQRWALFASVAFSIFAVMALLGYQLWSSYKEVIREAETKTRNYASVFDARLDGTLRRIDGDLQVLARTIPIAALSKTATPGYASAINATLASFRWKFDELESLQVFDSDGDLVYSSENSAAKVNISDRSHFRAMRDNRQGGPVFSDVVISRSTGSPGLYVAIALRDEQGVFRGAIAGGLSLAQIQAQFMSLDLGNHGSIAIYRSDKFTQVVRWPLGKVAIDAPLPLNNPTRQLISSGVWTATSELTSATDGRTRIYSYQRVEHAPFFVSVGLARDDILAPWRKSALVASIAGFVILTLLAVLLVRLVRATDQAQAASRAKSRFLANMSHEIRTPMNAILGMLVLLRKTELTNRQADYASKTEGAARALLGLLNEILDFSKIESGKMTLDPQPFRIDHLLRDLSVIVSANVGAKNVEVLFEIDPALPRLLIGDAMRLQQVLLNLSGNAIKFTAEGEVVVSLAVVRREAAAVTVEVAVRDTGIGIAPENQAGIFTAFTQAEASTTRRFGGTGLGVAISARLVTLMGGSIQLESTLGKGSRFHFCITLPVAAEPIDEALPCAPSPASLRILVVDDHPAACRLLKQIGESFGWIVDVAESSEQALDILNVARVSDVGYSAIFLDWQMPGPDGRETSRRIREIELNGAAPIIAMVTVYGQKKLVQRGEADQAPPDGFLVKPITASMLFDAVADAHNDQTRTRPSRLGITAGLNRLSGMRLLVVEDNHSNQQVARELLEYEGAIVQIADDGQQAVEAVAAAAPQFDAILMDLQMPVMDGFSATSHIRQDLGLLTLPIVAMTANAMASDREACLAVGMNDHVGKPFDIDHLVSVLCKQTGGAAAPGTTQAVAGLTLPAAVSAAAVESGVDIAAAVNRLGGNLGLYQRMLGIFIKDLADIPAQLAACVAGNDAPSAVRLLHTLKGQAATLGSMALAAEAARGEKQLAAGLTSNDMHSLVAQVTAVIPAASAGIAVLLQALQDAEAPIATPTKSLDTGAVLAQLRLIAQYLQNADMVATDAMTALRRQVGGSLGGRLQPIGEAIEALDFDHGLRLCNTLINELTEGLPA